eukprot:TRINITY_DN3785_c0_g1_i1.p1 TRINITY_DN3785_c0_g1~~TRINITY_DN3785_c0_g1_i1.p1  ORF type:complete len:210 (-),score=40.72 TRINITY_DN3785_c0_g1_i1:197-826(-)
MWGTPTAHTLRAFLANVSRPLLWADSEGSVMLIDPLVNSIAGGRITPGDVALWEAFWRNGSAAEPISAQQTHWDALVAAMPEHLKLSFVSWQTKAVCAEEEAAAGKMVLGVDGLGNCVFWEAAAGVLRWEMLNDGSCEQSSSMRALYESSTECTSASKATGWKCVRVSASDTQSGEEAAYCVPDITGNFTGVGACEAGCFTNSSLGGSH